MREFVSGSQLITRAALHAGCNFFAGYPITPATGILLDMLRLLPQHGGVAVQGEDEIASIGFCLGAASVGKKAMTATSGPGLSLYSESVGFAQMAELPLVIVNVQRMGPATGGATTNAEGDVMFCRWVTSGGYPLIVLCPSSLEETYTLTIHAFNLAQRFRTPVFLLTCKDLVLNKESVEVDRYEHPPIPDTPPAMAIGGEEMSRVNTSIHGPCGLMTRDPVVMQAHLDHLVHKIEDHIDAFSFMTTDLELGADTVIVAYGLAARSAREAARQLRQRGKMVSLVVLHTLWPVPEKKLREAVGTHRRVIVPEHNPGQYVLEVQRVFGDKTVVPVNRIDGDAITPGSLVQCVEG